MIQMKDMLNLFPKIPLYYNIPSKHAQEKCLNADFLTAGRLLQKKCLVVYYSSSIKQDDLASCEFVSTVQCHPGY